MTDSTHNALVTIMILISIWIAVILVGRAFQSQRYYSWSEYRYQPASAIDAPRYKETVTTYTTPAAVTDYVTTSTTSYDYETTYAGY